MPKPNFIKMTNKKVKYIHEEVVHNFKAANEVVPTLIKLLEPKSVVDVGCGIGTWLKVFKDNGVKNILGIDGEYVDKNLLKIEFESFKDFDLEKLYISNSKYDLAISLEVAEHLSELNSDVFIKTLTGLSDTVIFSAAIPNQGGQNHINEKEPRYWIEKFESLEYKTLDILRPIFWNNTNIDWWYRQNFILFTKDMNLIKKLESFHSFYGTHLVHHESSKLNDLSIDYYKNQLDKINQGKKKFKFYIKLIFLFFKNKIIS